MLAWFFSVFCKSVCKRLETHWSAVNNLTVVFNLKFRLCFRKVNVENELYHPGNEICDERFICVINREELYNFINLNAMLCAVFSMYLFGRGAENSNVYS